MAIELRKFARRRVVKVVSFLLCVAFACAAVGTTVYLVEHEAMEEQPDVLTLEPFVNTMSYYSQMYALVLPVLEASGWMTDDSAAVKEKLDANLERLRAQGGIQYWVKTPHMTLQNVGDEPDEGYFLARHHTVVLPGEETDLTVAGMAASPADSTLYFCIEETLYEQMREEFEVQRRAVLHIAALIVLLALLSCLCLLHLILVAGRRPGDSAVHLWWLDRIYLDLYLAALFLFVVGLAVFSENIFRLALETREVFWLMVPWTALFALCVGFLLSLAKYVKRREFWHSCLVLVIVHALWVLLKNFFGALFSAAPLTLVTGGATLLFGTLVWVTFPTPIPLFLILGATVFVVYKTVYFVKVSQGAEDVRAGQLNMQLPVKGRGALGKLSGNINGIAEGLQAQVGREMRAERMKTELVTNVSHDLRTPLTSIMTYVDLLKYEGLDAPDASRYLEIVDQKAKRLKTLTDDLFEAAKASSGTLQPQLETLQLRAMIEQALGELDDKLVQTKLDVRLSGEETAVRADGKMLWRVIENLFSNLFKYALPDSRVYISIDSVQQGGRLVMKNISAAPLNMAPSELTERFTRGDDARAGEGSGLGLSIAQSFITLQKGSFSIEIDGDLFKVTVILPRP